MMTDIKKGQSIRHKTISLVYYHVSFAYQTPNREIQPKPSCLIDSLHIYEDVVNQGFHLPLGSSQCDGQVVRLWLFSKGESGRSKGGIRGM